MSLRIEGQSAMLETLRRHPQAPNMANSSLEYAR